MVSGGVTTSYTYGADGLRTQKQYGSTTYNYYYVDGRLIRMTWANSYIDFLYDESGSVYSFVYDGDQYYFVKNLQGDVVQIYSIWGTLLVEYDYDAWGNCTVVYEHSSYGDLAEINPIRYRGYVYDFETGFYYLQSRYYDPQVRRFINADSYVNPNGDFLGFNLYAYCSNNPTNYIDPTGEAWYHWALGAAVVAACAVATIVTCGGFAAAATAVTLVASGTAAATTASTVAAGAFIGSSIALGTAAVTAASNSSSVDDFMDQGNWATVAYVATSAGTGGAYGYDLSKSTQSIVENLGRENLKDSSINFSRRAGEHMNEQGRRVPISILGDAIRYGSESPDPRGSQALQYEIQMYRNGSPYNLTVVFDWKTNTIYHFQYEH